MANPKPRQLGRDRYMDWRAGHIDDPVERLRFLRAKMERRRSVLASIPWRQLTFGAAVVFAFSVIFPMPTVVSDVSTSHNRGHIFPEREVGRRPATFADVWLVEEAKDYELYSNGLRIDKRFAVANQDRFYQVLDRNNDLTPLPGWQSQPVGIVYHTTESSIVPFDADRNDKLRHLAAGLVSGLQQTRSYNYVIDRFGRVSRVVEENSAANHSGNSIWADDKFVYLNLNNSFLGVAFEAQTAGGEEIINDAQIHAGKVLTEMLRAKYHIPAENCVTHAQVSVNPSNMRIGYHTDWASKFPFEDMGLPNNYDQPLASLTEFGFEYDDWFLKSIGNTVWHGIELSEAQFEKDASKHKRSVTEHRGLLQERYHKLYSALKLTGAMEEGNDATASNTSSNSK